ncbi:protein FAM174C [Kryptolebias marmoratus]|uniref:Family with sequence similarity 174 member C n=1 Tax=Kryptolebias marmoratus TaxID=37003 RepID=A0A3Q2ZZT3_KRYMA|nr:protein FAM174C [Kryptolebias marmoratus]
MTFWRVLSAVLVSACWLLCGTVAQKQNVTHNNGSTTTKPTTNLTGTDSSALGPKKGDYKRFGVDSSMIQRALYVLIGITLIGLLYFLIRAVRLKKPSLRKKYGLLSNYDDSVEMEAVDSEEDDTLYEARSLRR